MEKVDQGLNNLKIVTYLVEKTERIQGVKRSITSVPFLFKIS